MFRSSAYEQLKRLAPGSAICADIGSAISAKICLDGLWNAAK